MIPALAGWPQAMTAAITAAATRRRMQELVWLLQVGARVVLRAAGRPEQQMAALVEDWPQVHPESLGFLAAR